MPKLRQRALESHYDGIRSTPVDFADANDGLLAWPPRLYCVKNFGTYRTLQLDAGIVSYSGLMIVLKAFEYEHDSHE
jgi:hypothetical protein